MNWETDICYFKAARGTGSQWTAEEEQVLWELYPTGDVQTIMTLLPDRSLVAIINHARVLQSFAMVLLAHFFVSHVGLVV